MCVRWASNEWSDFSQYRTVKLKIMISFECVCVCVCLSLSLSLSLSFSVGQVQLCMKVSFVHIFSSLTDTAGCMRGAHISFPSLSLPLPLSLHTTELGVWKLHIYLFQSVSVWHSGVCKLHMHLDLSICVAQLVCESCTCILSYLSLYGTVSVWKLHLYLVLSLYGTIGHVSSPVSVWHSLCVKVAHVCLSMAQLVCKGWTCILSCLCTAQLVCESCTCILSCLSLAQLVCESCICILSCLCMAQLVCENCTCILSCFSLCDTVGVWKVALVSCPVSVWHSWCVKVAHVSCPVCLYGTVGVWRLHMYLVLSVWHSWCVKVVHVSCSVWHIWCVKVEHVSCPVCLCMAQLVCKSWTCILSCLCMAVLVCESCSCILSWPSLCMTSQLGLWKMNVNVYIFQKHFQTVGRIVTEKVPAYSRSFLFLPHPAFHSVWPSQSPVCPTTISERLSLGTTPLTHLSSVTT